MPYLLNLSTGAVFDAVTGGAIGPDGNPEWLAYEAWLADGNTPGEWSPA